MIPMTIAVIEDMIRTLSGHVECTCEDERKKLAQRRLYGIRVVTPDAPVDEAMVRYHLVGCARRRLHEEIHRMAWGLLVTVDSHPNKPPEYGSQWAPPPGRHT